MFVLVTVVAAWLASELNYIRGRRATVERVTQSGGDAMTCTYLVEFAANQGAVYNPARIPVWRRALGDEAIEMVRVPSTERELLRAATRLFPEAEVWEIDNYADPGGSDRFRLFRDAPRDRGEIK
jgi:hypothetical protein